MLFLGLEEKALEGKKNLVARSSFAQIEDVWDACHLKLVLGGLGGRVFLDEYLKGSDLKCCYPWVIPFLSTTGAHFELPGTNLVESPPLTLLACFEVRVFGDRFRLDWADFFVAAVFFMAFPPSRTLPPQRPAHRLCQTGNGVSQESSGSVVADGKMTVERLAVRRSGSPTFVIDAARWR